MRLAFVASPKEAAQAALRELAARYGQCDLCDADYVVALGGDGTVLEALYAVMTAGTHQPVFAMRLGGSVGYLANPLETSGLSERLHTARRVSLCPLKADVEHAAGHATLLAINEIVFMRQRLQAARLRVAVAQRRFPLLTGDGLVIATPIGSSGYNRSAGGPCLPQDSSMLALTALAAHHRSPWCNLVVGNDAEIEIEVLDADYRPVELQTTRDELKDISRARISISRDLKLTLLFESC